MQLRVARRLRGRRQGPASPWPLIGFVAGLAAGFLIGELFGSGTRKRVGRAVGSLGKGQTPPDRPERARTVFAVLAADPEFAEVRFQLVSASHGGFELRGWVASRAARTRAIRLARAAAGPVQLTDRILVRGEDDGAPALVRDDEPRSA